MRQLHSLRVGYEFFSNANPLMAPVAGFAEQVRKARRPATEDNPFLALQEGVSRQIVTALDGWRDMSEALAERVFMTIYGSPTLQAALGIDPTSTQSLRKAPKSALHRELMNKRVAELKSRIATGGLREVLIRGLLYAGMGRGAVDERGFEALQRVRDKYANVSLAEFKAIVREQFYMLLLDPEGALSAIPSMLPPEPEVRQKALDLIKEVLSARGELSADDRERLQRIGRLFGKEDRLTIVRKPSAAVRETTSKAS
jgi:hypothetical protein